MSNSGTRQHLHMSTILCCTYSQDGTSKRCLCRSVDHGISDRNGWFDWRMWPLYSGGKPIHPTHPRNRRLRKRMSVGEFEQYNHLPLRLTLIAQVGVAYANVRVNTVILRTRQWLIIRSAYAMYVFVAAIPAMIDVIAYTPTIDASAIRTPRKRHRCLRQSYEVIVGNLPEPIRCIAGDRSAQVHCFITEQIA